MLRHPYLHINDGGSGGIPMIFLHSFAGSIEQWARQLVHYRTQCRAVAFDLRGHGRSAPAPDDDYSIGAFAHDIGDVVDQLGFSQVILVGHSLGAAAALRYTGEKPDRVAALVLEEAPVRLPDNEKQAMLQALDADYDATMQRIWSRLLHNATERTCLLVREDSEHLPVDDAKAIIHATFEYNPLPDIAAYAGPVLSIFSTAGDLPTALHRVVPGVAHKRIGGTSHWMHMDKAEEFNDAVDAFLAPISMQLSTP